MGPCRSGPTPAPAPTDNVLPPRGEFDAQRRSQSVHCRPDRLQARARRRAGPGTGGAAARQRGRARAVAERHGGDAVDGLAHPPVPGGRRLGPGRRHRPQARHRPGAHRAGLRIGRADPGALPRLCRARRGGHPHPVRVPAVPDGRQDRRRRAGLGARRRLHRQRRRHPGAGDAAHQAGVPGQPQQPDRHLPGQRRGPPPARRAARSGDAGAGRGLRRVRPAQRLHRRYRAGGADRQHGHAADLLEGVRHGRAAARLGVLPEAGGRRPVFGAPALRRQHPGAGGRRRRDRGPGLPGRHDRPQRPLDAVAAGPVPRARPRAAADGRQFRDGAVPGRAGAQRRCRPPLPGRARHPGARDGRLRRARVHPAVGRQRGGQSPPGRGDPRFPERGRGHDATGSSSSAWR